MGLLELGQPPGLVDATSGFAGLRVAVGAASFVASWTAGAVVLVLLQLVLYHLLLCPAMLAADLLMSGLLALHGWLSALVWVLWVGVLVMPLC